MRWPIRLQIFVPFAGLLAAALLAGAAATSIVAARRVGAIETQRLVQVVQSLGETTFPYSEAVLQRMRGLSGAEYIAVDSSGRVQAATLPDLGDLPPLEGAPRLNTGSGSLGQFPAVRVGDRTWLVSSVETTGPDGPRRLYILYPQDLWNQLQWDSAWPPLAIGAVVLGMMLLVSGWLAHRIGRRVDLARGLFIELAAGRYPRVPTTSPGDELDELLASANELSARLEVLQGEIARTERLRVLAQLAGSLAHQLRNAITGARLAVQLHRRSCPSAQQDEGLDVALLQLNLTEQQVQSLLSLGRDPPRPAPQGDLSELLHDVEQLVRPQARHWEIQLDFDERLAAAVPVSDAPLVRGAVLNLVLNALEASGVGGRVRVAIDDCDSNVRIRIADSGLGPPEEIRERLGEPFVTSKPEGAGLGLALAEQAARSQGGRLTWRREEGATVFQMEWPRNEPPADADPASPAIHSGWRTANGGGLPPSRTISSVAADSLLTCEEPCRKS